MSTKNIKVYRYGLNNMVVVDAENKRYGIIRMLRDLDIENIEFKRVTKATVRKHHNDFKNNSHDPLILTSPILANFSEDYQEKKYHEHQARSIYLGGYNSLEELKKFIQKLYNITQPLRKKHHFVSFSYNLMDAINLLLNDGKSSEEKTNYIMDVIAGELTCKL